MTHNHSCRYPPWTRQAVDAIAGQQRLCAAAACGYRSNMCRSAVVAAAVVTTSE